MKRILTVIMLLILSVLLCFCGAKSENPVNSLDLAVSGDGGLETGPKAESAEVNEETSADTEELTSSPDTNAEDLPGIDESLPLSGIKICIDAGHGRFETKTYEAIGPGSSTTKAAFATGTAGSYQSEAEFNLKVAELLKTLLEEQGAEIYMTRTGEWAELSNIGRAQLANDNNCDIAVRIHADGSENTASHGISMLVPARNEFITDEYILTESTEAGEILLDAVLEKTGAKDLGIKPRSDLTGFNWSAVPSVLIECGFMTNPEEDARLADPAYQQLIAEGLTQGLITYFTDK